MAWRLPSPRSGDGSWPSPNHTTALDRACSASGRMAQELLTSLGTNRRARLGRPQRRRHAPPLFQPPTLGAARAALNRELDVIYAAFTAQVAESRNLDAANSHRRCRPRGRVFSGSRRCRKQAGLAGRAGAACSSPSTSPRPKAGLSEDQQSVEIRSLPRRRAIRRQSDDRSPGTKPTSATYVLAGHEHAARGARGAWRGPGIATLRPGNVRPPAAVALPLVDLAAWLKALLARASKPGPLRPRQISTRRSVGEIFLSISRLLRSGRLRLRAFGRWPRTTSFDLARLTCSTSYLSGV